MIRLESLKTALDIVATIALITASSLITSRVLTTRSNAAPVIEYSKGAQDVGAQKLELSLPEALVGKTTSPIVMVEFSDFQCPYCAKYARETLPKLRATFVDAGQIEYVFRHFPVAQIHPQAIRAAQVAYCGGEQGAFWQVHQSLFTELSGLSLPNRELASKLGLEKEAFISCLNEAERHVTQDMTEGSRIGVTGTPTFFLGKIRDKNRIQLSRRISGAVTYDVFESAISEMLGKKSS